MDKVDPPQELVAEFERATIERKKHPVVMKADVRAKEIGDSETEVPSDDAKTHPLGQGLARVEETGHLASQELQSIAILYIG